MKQALSLLVLFGALLILEACPAHYAVFTWSPGASYPASVVYHVYRSQLPATGFVMVATEPLSTPNYGDTSVVSGQTYYYRVTAYDTSSARESLPSPTVSTVIP